MRKFRTLTALTALITLGACASTPSLTFWDDDKPEAPSGTTLLTDNAPNGAIGGMGWLNETTLLISRDTKNYDGLRFGDIRNSPFAELPLATARKTATGFDLSAVRLTVASAPFLQKELAPSDLEALCLPEGMKMRDGKVTVIATESHRTHYGRSDPGQVFLLELKQKGSDWQAEVVGAVSLPKDYDLSGKPREADNVQVEGIACMKQPRGGYSILLGYRGQHSLPPTADDYVGMLALFRNVTFNVSGDAPAQLPDLSDASVSLRNIGHAVKPACVGTPRQEGGEWRDIADLYVGRRGDILAASSYEGTNTEGTASFCSTIYKTGFHLDFDGRGWILDGDGLPMRIKEMADYKVEALAPQKPGSHHLILGYDNEDIGSGIVAP